MSRKHSMHKHRGQPATLAVGVGAAAGLGLVVLAAAAGYAIVSRKSRGGYSRQAWEGAVNEDGSIVDFASIAAQIAQRGMDPEVRGEVWPFLLGVFDPASTRQQRQQQYDAVVDEFQQLLLNCQALEALLHESLDASNSKDSQKRRPFAATATAAEGAAAATAPDAVAEEVVQFAEAHRIIVIDAVRTDYAKHAAALLHGGSGAVAGDGARYGMGGAAVGAAAGKAVAALAEKQAHVGQWINGWLMGASAGSEADASGSGSDSEDGDSASASARGAHGYTISLQRRRSLPQAATWVSAAAQQVLDNSPHLSKDSKRQAARLIALLSAYAVHDPETGYCQGMSDLAVPFLMLLDDDSLAFACFDALMRGRGACRNFAVDEAGIFGQLRRLAGLLAAADKTLHHKLRALGAAECLWAYRMVVVQMRRDLPLPEAMTLWDLLWSDAWLHEHRQGSISKQQQQQQQQQQQLPVKEAEAAEGTSHQRQDAEPPAQATASSSAGSTAGQGVSAAPSQALDMGAASGSNSSRGGGGGGAVAVGASGSSPPEEEPAPGLFLNFVAGVEINQKRRVMDECHDTDDVLRLFHTLRPSLWDCFNRARQLRVGAMASGARADAGSR